MSAAVLVTGITGDAPGRAAALLRRRPASRRLMPGFGLSLGVTLCYLGLIVVLPLSALVLRASALSWTQIIQAVSGPRALAAFRLSLGCSLVAAALNAGLGTLLAWVLVRYRFPGRALLDSLVDLPLALPTAVAGIALCAVYADTGPVGRLLAAHGVTVAFAPAGVVIALTFVGLPLLVRTVEPVLRDLDPHVEEAAAVLGAGRLRTLIFVVLPALLPAIATGFALAFARALGEYGSVVFISGNMPLRTEIVPLLIVTKLEQYDYGGATAIAVVMLLLSLGLLLLLNALPVGARARARPARPDRAAGPDHAGSAQGPALLAPAPLRAALIAAAALWLGLLVIAPLGMVFAAALDKGLPGLLAALRDPDNRAAIRLTLLVAAIVVPLNTAFGVAAAWLIARHRFLGRGLLLSVIDLPFSVSPVIAGLIFVLLFGRDGHLGPWLQAHGVHVLFAPPGLVLATLFVTLPFVARELVPLMEAQGQAEEEAALTLGASGLYTFVRVTLPKIRWALLSGVVMCNARAMGEFGAASVVSGHVRGVTTTLPLQVEMLYDEYNLSGAFGMASLLALLALLTLLAKRLLSHRPAGRGVAVAQGNGVTP